MTLIADKETGAVLARLKEAIANAGYSLRGLATESIRLELEPPESIIHSVLSETLSRNTGRNFYLQRLFAICKIINIHPAEVIFGEDAGLAVQAMERLPANERAEILRDMEQRLSHHRATAQLRARLRER